MELYCTPWIVLNASLNKLTNDQTIKKIKNKQRSKLNIWFRNKDKFNEGVPIGTCTPENNYASNIFLYFLLIFHIFLITVILFQTFNAVVIIICDEFISVLLFDIFVYTNTDLLVCYYKYD